MSEIIQNTNETLIADIIFESTCYTFNVCHGKIEIFFLKLF